MCLRCHMAVPLESLQPCLSNRVFLPMPLPPLFFASRGFVCRGFVPVPRECQFENRACASEKLQFHVCMQRVSSRGSRTLIARPYSCLAKPKHVPVEATFPCLCCLHSRVSGELLPVSLRACGDTRACGIDTYVRRVPAYPCLIDTYVCLVPAYPGLT